jgi:hypothetical protein
MASGSQGPKQSNGYFVPLGDCRAKVLKYTGGDGAGGSFRPGSFSQAVWNDTDSNSKYLSSISSLGAGGLLKDMGKTVVSSNRTFRKVQLVAPSLSAGVVGGTGSQGQYLTGYVELATGNALATDAAKDGPAPLAYLPGLLM